MRLTFLAALAGVAALAVPLPGRADAPVTEFTLGNGMEVVVIEDHRAPVVTNMVWYRVGAGDEVPGKSGLAHFLEHLMFKGTDTIPDGAFAKIVAELGGEDNAFTTQDYTAYFERVAKDRLGRVMGMEADRMRHLKLTPDEVKTERQVILEERNMRIDNDPEALFSEQMDAALYMNEPYGIPTIGWRHEMEGLTREDALAFYRKYYAPDNAVAVIAGDVTPGEVRTLAEDTYGKLQPSGEHRAARPTEPPQLAARRIDMVDPRVGQPFVEREYLVPTYDAANPKEAAALDLLADVLGGGTTSRFTQALEFGDGIAVDAGAFYSPAAMDATAFGVYGVPKAGHSLTEIEKALDAQIAKIKADGPTKEELDRVKSALQASLIYAQDSQSALARRYGMALAVGRTVEDVKKWPDVVESVTPAEVQAVAKKYLVPAHSVTGTLRSSEQEAG